MFELSNFFLLQRPHYSLVHVAVLTQDINLLTNIVAGFEDEIAVLVQRTSCLEQNTPLHLGKGVFLLLKVVR